MKTITNIQLNKGQEIINTLGVNKAVIAINSFNVETNNINKRMFLYSDDKILLSTSGNIFFGTIKDGNKKFTFNPSQNLPYVVGHADAKTRIDVKEQIRNVLKNHKDVLQLSNAYKHLTEQFEDALAYIIKNGLIKGDSLNAGLQLRYDWLLDPSLISVIDETSKEIAATDKTNKTSENRGVVNMVKRIERNQIMMVAHNIRRRMEATDAEYASYRYVERMAIALVQAWDLYKTQDNNTTAKEVAPEIATPVVEKDAAATKHPVEVPKQTTELIAKEDDGIKRTAGLFYVMAEPGVITIEDYTGKIVKRTDISQITIAKRSLSILNVKFTEREFAKSNLYKENASKFVIFTSHKDEYSQYRTPRAFMNVK